MIGRPAVLIPFAAATGDHQNANAQGLVDAGAALRLREDELTPASLAEAMYTVLSQPDLAMQMSQAATGAGIADATERLVRAVERLAQE